MVDRFSATSRDTKGGRVSAFRGELDLSRCDGLVEQIGTSNGGYRPPRNSYLTPYGSGGRRL